MKRPHATEPWRVAASDSESPGSHALGRAPRCVAASAACGRCGVPGMRGAPAAPVGASHRLPSAARHGVVRRNSLRSLRELRSDRAPQVRSTMRASRADPDAALLGAAEGAPRIPGTPHRPHAALAATHRGALPNAWLPGDSLPLAAKATSVAFQAKTGLFLASTTTVTAKAPATALAERLGRPRPKGWPGACPVGRGRALCAAEKRSRTGGARSAHRPSFSRRLSERSSRSERSEFRRASRCGEHRRAPPRSGGKHPARPRPTGQAPGQPLGPGLPKRSANAVAGAFAHATLPRS